MSVYSQHDLETLIDVAVGEEREARAMMAKRIKRLEAALAKIIMIGTAVGTPTMRLDNAVAIARAAFDKAAVK